MEFESLSTPKAFQYSVLVHILFIVIFILSWKHIPEPKPIQVSLWSNDEIADTTEENATALSSAHSTISQQIHPTPSPLQKAELSVQPSIPAKLKTHEEAIHAHSSDYVSAPKLEDEKGDIQIERIQSKKIYHKHKIKTLHREQLHLTHRERTFHQPPKSFHKPQIVTHSTSAAHVEHNEKAINHSPRFLHKPRKVILSHEEPVPIHLKINHHKPEKLSHRLQQVVPIQHEQASIYPEQKAKTPAKNIIRLKNTISLHKTPFPEHIKRNTHNAVNKPKLNSITKNDQVTSDLLDDKAKWIEGHLNMTTPISSRSSQEFSNQRTNKMSLPSVGQKYKNGLDCAQLSTYCVKIQRKVRGNITWSNTQNVPSMTIFEVTLLPDGEVGDIVLKHRSGNFAYDNSVKNAIKASSPFPRPITPEQRTLILRLRPS